MTVSFSIMDEKSIDETIAELRAADKRLVRAFKGGLKAGGAVIARKISANTPQDTGAMEDSIYVQDDGVVGVAAPYAAIVEEVHPTKAHFIKRAVLDSQDKAVDAIAKTTDKLSATGGGPADVHHEFRDRPGYIPRETFSGKRKRDRIRARKAKKRGGR